MVAHTLKNESFPSDNFTTPSLVHTVMAYSVREFAL